MENSKRKRPIGARPILQLGLPAGLALLLLVILLVGLQKVVPAHASPGTLYVDGVGGSDTITCGEPAAACRTISYTLNTRAVDGDSLFVAAGTYTENLTITGLSVLLRGGYTISGTTWLTDTGKTVIDGGSAGRTLVIHNSNSVLENLTLAGGAAPPLECWGDTLWVTNGDVTIRAATLKENNGGCSAVEVNHDFGPAHLALESSTVTGMAGVTTFHVWGDMASATVTGTTFVGNMAGDAGGGIQVDFGSSAFISNTLVFSNTAGDVGGGIAVRDGASASVHGTQVFSNTAMAAGGGIGVGNAVLNVTDSEIMHNQAPNGQSGAIEVQAGATANVWDSIIADNLTLLHGGAATVEAGATLNLVNTLLTGNASSSGNANVLATSGDVTMMNGTVSDNNPQGAQAVILWSGHMTITNSIFWNNAFNLQGDPPCPTCFTVTYSDIEGGWSGTGNLDADPLFAGGGDYHLQAGSPAVDAGTNASAPDHDLDGEPRPQDGDGDGAAVVDMGVYELGLYKIYIPLILANFGS